MLRSLLPLVLALLAAATPARAETVWPDTDLARHARAWFEQMTGSDEDARGFLTTHMAPKALAEVGVADRMARRRSMLDRIGALVPLEVLESTPARLRVRARDPHGAEPVVTFDGEAEAPHRILGIGVMLGGPGGDGPPPPTGPPLTDAEAVAAIEAHLDAEAAAGHFSGAALLARDGVPLLRRAWGLADRAAKTPIRPDTRFNLASIGKILTKTAVAQLVEAGKLKLDDPLARFLPDFPNADRITIAMLVDHRSGVGDFFNERYETMDRSKLRHNRDYLELIRDQPLWFAPGTSERYSNGGYALLGEVVARASGLDYYDYLRTKIFAPAGMKDTAALLEGDGTPNVARGYTTEGAAKGEERDNVATRPWRGSAAGGSYSTLDDLLAFDQALLENRLCSAEWSAWVAGSPPPFGFGFAGGAPGISTEWTHEGAITLIVLTNRDPEVTRPVLRPVQGFVMRMTH